MVTRSSTGSILLLLLPVLFGAPATEGGTFEQVAKLTGADTAGGDFFGYGVAIDGDRLVVGAQWDDDLGPQAGSAFVFERDPAGSGDWREVAKLLAPDGVAEDWFGAAVAVNRETVVVGAVLEVILRQSRPAYAYVFEPDGEGSWRAVAKLEAEGGEVDDAFGAPVAISGDTAVVGAGFADGPGGSNDGAVYVFERDAGGPGKWGQTAKLTPAKTCDTDPPERDSAACGWVSDQAFGASVSLTGGVLAVGLSDAVGLPGVYLFRRFGQGPESRWQLWTRIVPEEWGFRDGIGSATAIDGGTLLLGAYGDDDFGGQSGAAYVYEADPGAPTGVRRTAKLYAPEPGSGAYFGDAVALDGETAIVGAPYTGGCLCGGFAYILRREEGATRGWVAVAELEPRQLANGDHFGDTVAISGDTAVVGAWGDDDRGTQAGAVYVFQETTTDALEPR